MKSQTILPELDDESFLIVASYCNLDDLPHLLTHRMLAKTMVEKRIATPKRPSQHKYDVITFSNHKKDQLKEFFANPEIYSQIASLSSPDTLSEQKNYKEYQHVSQAYKLAREVCVYSPSIVEDLLTSTPSPYHYQALMFWYELGGVDFETRLFNHAKRTKKNDYLYDFYLKNPAYQEQILKSEMGKRMVRRCIAEISKGTREGLQKILQMDPQFANIVSQNETPLSLCLLRDKLDKVEDLLNASANPMLSGNNKKPTPFEIFLNKYGTRQPNLLKLFLTKIPENKRQEALLIAKRLELLPQILQAIKKAKLDEHYLKVGDFDLLSELIQHKIIFPRLFSIIGQQGCEQLQQIFKNPPEKTVNEVKINFSETKQSAPNLKGLLHQFERNLYNISGAIRYQKKCSMTRICCSLKSEQEEIINQGPKEPYALLKWLESRQEICFKWISLLEMAIPLNSQSKVTEVHASTFHHSSQPVNSAESLHQQPRIAL